MFSLRISHHFCCDFPIENMRNVLKETELLKEKALSTAGLFRINAILYKKLSYFTPKGEDGLI